MKLSFWSRPNELSFKDVLAVMFSGTFLFFAWEAVKNKEALAVVQALVPLIGIILGGYFVQESAAMWFMRSQGVQNPYYNPYGYDYYTQPMIYQQPQVATNTTQSTEPQDDTQAQGGEAQ